MWRQASILDTVFEGSVRTEGDESVIPLIRGRAWVNGEATLILDPTDPFRFGIQDRGGSLSFKAGT